MHEILEINHYLKVSKFSLLKFWDYYTLSNKFNINSYFQVVMFKEVIKHRKIFITINDEKEYKRCRVQLYGRGVVLRDLVLGKDILTKKQQVCVKNDFIVAEIDAKFGGYGIVPAELNNAIVSSHYFLFEVNYKRILADFLSILLKCKGFSKQVKSTGSTNYSAIRPYHVLNYLIPLPPLDKQQKFVDAYSQKNSEADYEMKKSRFKEQKIDSYLLDILGPLSSHVSRVAHSSTVSTGSRPPAGAPQASRTTVRTSNSAPSASATKTAAAAVSSSGGGRGGA